MAEPDNEKQWPGVHRAYDFVLPSYQLLTARFEAADNRIQSLLTFAASFTVAVPILAKAVNDRVSFRSLWFLGALAVFLLMVVLSIVGRVCGSLRLINPGIFEDDPAWLAHDDWHFKRAMVIWAGKDFKDNKYQVWRKGQIALVMAGLFVLMIGLLVAWIATAPWPLALAHHHALLRLASSADPPAVV